MLLIHSLTLSLGIILQDLLTMEEIESKQDGLHNFKKMRRLASAFEFIQHRQKVHCTYLTHHSPSPTVDCHHFSSQLPLAFHWNCLLTFAFALDSKESFDSMPPEYLGEYLTSANLLVLSEN